MAKKKNAPVLRAQGEDPAPATITKSYAVRDKWLDKAKDNLVEFKSVDGEISDLKVNGEPAGGGGMTACDVVVKNNYRSSVYVKAPYYYNDALTGVSTIMVTGLTSTYYNVALYNGSCKIKTDEDRTFTVTSGSATASGNAAIVTGNCELAIS